jgi:hypothetical protein
MTNPHFTLENSFQLIAVKPAAVPAGAQGADWHQYVIQQGENEIRGYSQGSVLAVTAHVEEMVTRLNERRTHKSGRKQIYLGNRKPRQG